MKTLHRYLLGQVIASLLLTAAVFTAVLLFGNLLREILPLLISRRVTFGLIAQAFGLLIPFVWVFALPMGMLTAALLVFGRFSADQELTAARASGISLLSLITPIVMFSLLLCAISAAVNLEIAPRCRVAYNGLRDELRPMLLNAQLPEGRPITEFPGYIVYIGKNRRGKLEDIKVFKLKSDSEYLESKVSAPRGDLTVDVPNQKVVLRLFECEGVWVDSAMPFAVSELAIELDWSDAKRAAKAPGISDMTFRQLQAELHDVERRMSLPLTADEIKAGERERKNQRKQWRDVAERIRVQIHRQVAFSFACFGFTLIGIPLGIRAHRRETNVGIAITLGLVAVYYGLIIAAQSLTNRPELAPHLLMWTPNFLFQAVGAVLLWRANRGI